jgi:hypothetical protein
VDAITVQFAHELLDTTLEIDAAEPSYVWPRT